MKMNKNTNSEPTITTQLLKRYSLPIVKIGRLVKYRLSDLEKSITDNIV